MGAKGAKVKGFSGEHLYEVERKVNEFLIDKKLINTSITSNVHGYTTYYTILVSYELTV